MDYIINYGSKQFNGWDSIHNIRSYDREISTSNGYRTVQC